MAEGQLVVALFPQFVVSGGADGRSFVHTEEFDVRYQLSVDEKSLCVQVSNSRKLSYTQCCWNS